MNYRQRMHRAFRNAPCLPLYESSRYLLISDCHRGNGSSNDNFLKNQHLYAAALEYYYRHGYTYIELGDGDELWENHSMEQILEVHNHIFRILARFYREGRFYSLYGNHDIVKKLPQTARCFAKDCSEPQTQALFPEITFYSGLILRDAKETMDLYLTHGHQTDFLNSTLWRFSRFLVRYLWGPAERLGFRDPTSAAKNNKKKRRTEEKLTQWAKEEGHILITGHTHRPMIGTPEAPYCNTGSCVHPHGITCIEVCHRCMTLVKWSLDTRPDQNLYVSREVLAESVCIDEYKAGKNDA